MGLDRLRPLAADHDSNGPAEVAPNSEASEIDMLMERLRAEVAAGVTATGDDQSAGPAGEAATMPDAPPMRSVRQLLALPNSEFVAAAYWAVFGREADPEGRRTVRRRLDIGLVSRIDVLVEFRRSAEGREKRRHVPGLAWRVALRRARHTDLVNVIRSASRLVYNLPRLVLYMRNVVARIDGVEQRAVDAESAAIRAEAELAHTREAIRVLTGRVARLESAVQDNGANDR